MTHGIIITPAPADESAAEDDLLDHAFGLSRRTKTSYRLREGGQPITGLSFHARDAQGRLAGIISFWPLRIGRAGLAALLLGPLAVDPDLRGRGIGLTLMRHGLDKAGEAGHRLVILVGDEPYYRRAGFAIVPRGQLQLPGPVEPDRLLYRELVQGSLQQAQGLALSPRHYRSLSATPPGVGTKI